MERKGIDVSKWQGTIDWEKVKNAGIEFAIIRSGFGRDSVDPKFKDNITGAQKCGIPCGIYHYTYALSTDEAKKEVEFFLNTVKGFTPEYPLIVDIEDASIAALGKDTLTKIAQIFCEEIEAAGYYAMIYSNANWLKNVLDMNVLSKYDVWLASWTEKPAYDGNYGIWQYSSNGSVDGISGRVDLDIAYKDYAAIIKEKGLNGFGKPQGAQTPPQTPAQPSVPVSAPPPAKPTEYTVKAGDTLSAIASKFGTTVATLAALNSIKNINLIYVGQKIKLPQVVQTTPAAPAAFKVGDAVRVKASAKTYATGQAIPDWVKGKADTILQLKSDRALLKGIYSWVLLSDLVK